MARARVPSSLAMRGHAFAAADAWSHRILMRRPCPEANHQPVDHALAQAVSCGGNMLQWEAAG